MYIYIYAGWWCQPTPLKNMKVSWDDGIPNIWKIEKCSEPLTIVKVFFGARHTGAWSRLTVLNRNASIATKMRSHSSHIPIQPLQISAA